MREFDAETVAAIVALSRAVREGDDTGTREALVRLGAKNPESAPEFEAARDLLRGFFSPVLSPGKHRLEAGVRAESLEPRNIAC